MSGFGERAVASLAGLPDFLIYLAASLGLVALFIVLYILVTPQRELTMIRAGNQAAAISLGGAILGFAIPLSMSVAQSHNIVDMLVWSGIALIVQLGVFFLCGLVIDHEARRITEGDRATAVFIAFASISAGLIDAACMTYPGP
jgi:putative membrane protein